MTFENAYADARFADAYATLGFHRTYHLAYRDLPEILRAHVGGRRALDFGCGAGRSTRFLRGLGFDAVGVDISEAMIARARALDPAGDYRLLDDGDLEPLGGAGFDLAFSGFTFDNVPTHVRKVALFRGLRRVLAPHGRIVNLVSSPEIYTHEWASFSTRDFPGNRQACSGDVVLIINTDIPDSRPVQDILWTDASYREVYDLAGLAIEARRAPLARGDEPYEWVNETAVAPWVIYVLRPADGRDAAAREEPRHAIQGRGPRPNGAARDA